MTHVSAVNVPPPGDFDLPPQDPPVPMPSPTPEPDLPPEPGREMPKPGKNA